MDGTIQFYSGIVNNEQFRDDLLALLRKYQYEATWVSSKELAIYKMVDIGSVLD